MNSYNIRASMFFLPLHVAFCKIPLQQRISVNTSRNLPSMSMKYIFIVWIVQMQGFLGNEDAKRLYGDLLKRSRGYKLRPVGNASSRMTLNLGLRLSQLVDVDEKNQIITTNVWLLHEWVDTSLAWDPSRYSGLERINIPCENIWLPDVVLYNNADGNYEVTLMTKVTLHSTGRVTWEPPVVYKSFCAIDVEFYPFDVQTCSLKFGSWTYDGYQIDLKPLGVHRSTQLDNDDDDDDNDEEADSLDESIDLREFYPSVEWDLLGVPAKRNEKNYPCCAEPYLDITFSIIIRRKTLFHVVNLIIPCVAITFLTVLVFFLPSESGEKISLSVSILLSLTVFFLLLAEIIPSTSIVVPLIVKYLIFTIILVFLSTIATVCVLNVHFRSPSTHVMAPWVRKMFLVTLPKLLGMTKSQFCFGSSVSNGTRLVDSVEMETWKCPAFEDGHQTPGGCWPGSHRDESANRGKSCDTFVESGRLPCATSQSEKRNKSLSPSRLWVVDSRLRWKLPRPKIPDPPLYPHVELRKSNSAQFASYGLIQRSRRYAYSAVTSRKCFKTTQIDALRNSEEMRFFKNFQEFRKGIEYLADHMKKEDSDLNAKEDWKFVARVLDRLFLWIFTSACLVGTAGIMLQAPSIYDKSTPIGGKQEA